MRAKSRPSASRASKSRVTSVGLRIASGAGAGAPGAAGAAAGAAGARSTKRKLVIGLRLALLEHLELVRPQVGNEVALLVACHHVEDDGLRARAEDGRAAACGAGGVAEAP